MNLKTTRRWGFCENAMVIRFLAHRYDVGVLELNQARPHFLSWALIACSHMHSYEQAVAECYKAVVLFLEDACCCTIKASSPRSVMQPTRACHRTTCQASEPGSCSPMRLCRAEGPRILNLAPRPSLSLSILLPYEPIALISLLRKSHATSDKLR